jgi:glycosyltransferase involved in cell wall biosynthesis
MFEVVVAIPTFRRPKKLARLLDALERVRTASRVSVIVADNDATLHEGADLCARRAPSDRWKLTSIVVAERGISHVRNALIEHALATTSASFIAMIDDDEWPSPQWLDELLRVQAETGADVVQGSILFPDPSNPSLTNCEGIASVRRSTGVVSMLQGTGNLLIARTCIAGLSRPWFDPAFALSGGEDREFFVRLAKMGKRFAWADRAIAHGDTPAERMNWRSVMRRAYSVGNSDMRVAMKHGPVWNSLGVEWIRIAAAVFFSPVLSLALLSSPTRRLEGPRLFFRAVGKAAAILGFRYDAYAVPHGE